MELVDIGANLTHNSFTDDLEAVRARAAEAGVGRIVVTGTSMPGSERALEIAKTSDTLFATAGVHPHHASKWADERSADRQRGLADDPKVVAIGECGLDYERNFSPPEDQRRCFEAQLQLAVKLAMPVFLHERRAHEDFVAMLREFRPSLPGGVVHCFTGTEEELDVYLELDMHIGLTGWICDERRGTHLHPIIGKIPAKRLMIETDAPFLMPRTIKPQPRTRRNEPAHLTYVAETVAECTDKSVEKVAKETTRTANAFFGLED